MPTVSPLQVLSERFNKLHKLRTELSAQEKNALIERFILLLGLGKSITDSMKAKNILDELAYGKRQKELSKEPLEKYYKPKKSKVKGKSSDGKGKPEESLEEYYKPKSKVNGKPKKPNNKAKLKQSKVKAKPKKSKKSKRVKKSKAKGKTSKKSEEYIRF